ncbi:5-oxoprolinase subunit PxpA [Paraferrimonas sedimenticola]|uniref:Uncharacterized protein n=1 Tax=Paraferrimonas sedimenticola TaxID=375674 RepID=A0AA37RWF8_9GAMM|nr:5-oxoprolinase subunit PxpA [Paraferrimonas sedimenticola]GLP95992.1 hypothetical protein GCM10007895_12980 [Paraferrimonas sedimenticola]
MQLNCDLGEGQDNDPLLMPYLDQANIACGGHAGSLDSILATLQLAKRHGVAVGAHPGYPDPEHFGRRSLGMPFEDLSDSLQQQLTLFDQACGQLDMTWDFIKVHGALYNDMMADTQLLSQLFEWAQQYYPEKAWVIQSSPAFETHQQLAQNAGIKVRFEAFADRNYQNNGALQPRSQPQALIDNPEQAAQRLRHYQANASLISLKGQALSFPVDTWCVHSDSANALAITQACRRALNEQGH